MPSPSQTRRQGSAAARSLAASRARGRAYSATGEPLEYLHFAQRNSPLPDDGEEFPPTVLLNRKFHIVGAFATWGLPEDPEETDETAFEILVTLDGADQDNTTFTEADFPQDALKPVSLPTDPDADPIVYEKNQKISLRVVTSESVEKSEFILILRPVR